MVIFMTKPRRLAVVVLLIHHLILILVHQTPGGENCAWSKERARAYTCQRTRRRRRCVTIASLRYRGWRHDAIGRRVVGAEQMCLRMYAHAVTANPSSNWHRKVRSLVRPSANPPPNHPR